MSVVTEMGDPEDLPQDRPRCHVCGSDVTVPLARISIDDEWACANCYIIFTHHSRDIVGTINPFYWDAADHLVDHHTDA